MVQLVPQNTTPRQFVTDEFNARVDKIRVMLESEDFVSNYAVEQIGFDPLKTKLTLEIDHYGGFTYAELLASSEPIPPKHYSTRVIKYSRRSIQGFLAYGALVFSEITDVLLVDVLQVALAILTTTGKLIEAEDLIITNVDAVAEGIQVDFRVSQNSLDFIGSGRVVLSPTAPTVLTGINLGVEANGIARNYAGGTFSFLGTTYNGCFGQINVADCNQGLVSFNSGSTALKGGFYLGENPLDRRQGGLFFSKSGSNLVFVDDYDNLIATVPYTTGQDLYWEHVNGYIRVIYGTRVINFKIKLDGLKAGVLYTKGTNSPTANLFSLRPIDYTEATPLYLRLMFVFNRRTIALDIDPANFEIDYIAESSRDSDGNVTRGRVVGKTFALARPISLPDNMVSVTRQAKRRLAVQRYNPVLEGQLPLNQFGALPLGMTVGTMASSVTQQQIIDALALKYDFSVEHADFSFTPTVSSMGWLTWSDICPTYYGTIKVDLTALVEDQG